MHQADISDHRGEGDVQQGEAGTRVRYYSQHSVCGDVLDVERAEAATLAQRGQRELGALWRGQERDPGA